MQKIQKHNILSLKGVTFMFRRKKYIVSILILLISIFSMVSLIIAENDIIENEVEFQDIPNNWSTEALLNSIDNGLLKGYNGKLKPDDNLTRAEMATIINRSFRSYIKADLEEFIDIDPEDWYYEEMGKAIQMKTFKGYNNRLNPNDPITREEAFVVISRAFKIDTTNMEPNEYSDLAEISDWAKKEIYGLIEAGYITGSDGIINPKGHITRAEFAQIMDNMIKGYIRRPGVYDSVEKGNIMINVPGVILRDTVVNGNLYIGEGVGDGDIILDNIIINGKLVVRGGGENTVIITGDSKIPRVIVSRYDGPVKLKIRDNGYVEKVEVYGGKERIILEGNIDTLDIQDDISIIIENGEINNINSIISNPNIIVKDSVEIKNKW